MDMLTWLELLLIELGSLMITRALHDVHLPDCPDAVLRRTHRSLSQRLGRYANLITGLCRVRVLDAEQFPDSNT